VLQRVAACCSMLQCVAKLLLSCFVFYMAKGVACCSGAMCCSVLQNCYCHVLYGEGCSVLQRVAACCSVLQCVAVCCRIATVMFLYGEAVSMLQYLHSCSVLLFVAKLLLSCLI